MSQIFSHLTLRHLKLGWSIYWRIELPFWIHTIFGLALFFGILLLQTSSLLLSLEKFVPNILEWPILFNLLFAVVLFFMCRPLLRKFVAWVEDKVESKYFLAQFSLLQSLEKFNRGLVVLVIAFFFLMTTQWSSLMLRMPYFRLWVVLFVLILFGIVTVVVALYGWLADQYKDDDTLNG